MFHLCYVLAHVLRHHVLVQLLADLNSKDMRNSAHASKSLANWPSKMQTHNAVDQIRAQLLVRCNARLIDARMTGDIGTTV